MVISCIRYCFTNTRNADRDPGHWGFGEEEIRKVTLPSSEICDLATEWCGSGGDFSMKSGVLISMLSVNDSY